MEHIEGGFVLLARRIVSSSLMAMKGNDVKLGIYFLGKVNWKNEKWYDQCQHKEIIIKRGETIGTLRKWAKQSKMSLQRLRTSLRRLIEHGFLCNITPACVKLTHGYTHLRVRKYERYQDFTNYGIDLSAESTQPQHRPNTDLTHIDETSKHLKQGGEGESKGSDNTSLPPLSDSTILPAGATRPEEREGQALVKVWNGLYKRWAVKNGEASQEYSWGTWDAKNLGELLEKNSCDELICLMVYYMSYLEGAKTTKAFGRKLSQIKEVMEAEGWRICRTFLTEFKALNPNLFPSE